VTAGADSQTLYVYAGVFNAAGTLTATLKDSADNTLDSNSDTFAVTSGGGKTRWEVTFSHPSAATLTVEWENATDHGDWDNVQLFGATLVPEPATLALLGLGGLVTIARRRRT
jgi:hypothetical protein